MATLANFLIGIGIQNDTTKGAREVQSSLDSIKRSSLQAGLAVGAMTGGLGLMAGNTAKNIRTFSQFAEQIGGSTELIAAQSEAWQRAGGSASGYMGLLSRLTAMRAGVLKGNTEWISEAAKVGFSPDAMMNNTADQLLPMLIARMNRMSPEQRVNAQNMLGAESTLINISADGRGAFNDQVEKQLKRLTITKAMTDQSEQLVTNWSDAKSELSAIADIASLSLMPTMNELLETTLEWVSANREGLHGGVASSMETLAENIGAVAGGLVALNVASLGATVEKFTKLGGTANGIGNLAKNLGLVGVAAAGASVGASVIDDKLQSFNWYNQSDEWFTKKVFELTGIDMSRGGVYSNQPTVITPDMTAPLSQPAQQAEAYHERMASYAPPAQSNYPARKTEEHIHVHLSEREVAHFIRQVNSQDAEQAVRDLRSPIDR
ncbi:hypothetical protein R0H32_008845 [Vibrio cholerae]|uniref:hypothetical protein n=1 Tax=Vibrio cholerae TaxID=666 RepID=UPI002935C0EA|nr:hypothetical protein [Vibrio cholerae]MDW4534652.1 hypothetical protein [Vibrio cholerae]